jgi:DNA-binding GntR family transcriptional regulator
MSEALRRISVVDELAYVLRAAILDGRFAAGKPLRETELADGYGVSRHTLRAALRRLAEEGLVRLEPHRGARVASLDRAELIGLFEVRTALEVEAARLALERHSGRLPEDVHAALHRLVAATERARPSWADISRRHTELHGAIVAASESARLRAEYARLGAELELFLLQLRPVWPLDRMRTHHQELLDGLERDGTEILRRHLLEGQAAIVGALPETREAPPEQGFFE